MNPMEALGVAIESERVASRMTRDELAEAVGISAETLGRIVRGESDPPYSRLVAVAEALGVALQDILTRAEVVAGRIPRRAETAQANTGGANLQVAGDVTGDVTVVAENAAVEPHMTRVD